MREIITEFDEYIDSTKAGDTNHGKRIAALQATLFKGMRADLGEKD
jgi:hypothetical protein